MCRATFSFRGQSFGLCKLRCVRTLSKSRTALNDISPTGRLISSVETHRACTPENQEQPPPTHPNSINPLFLQPARISGTDMSSTSIYAGPNGTSVQFGTPEGEEEDLLSSRTVSVAVFSSTSSGETRYRRYSARAATTQRPMEQRCTLEHTPL